MGGGGAGPQRGVISNFSSPGTLWQGANHNLSSQGPVSPCQNAQILVEPKFPTLARQKSKKFLPGVSWRDKFWFLDPRNSCPAPTFSTKCCLGKKRRGLAETIPERQRSADAGARVVELLMRLSDSIGIGVGVARLLQDGQGVLPVPKWDH